jgi:hypothetical protein
MKQAILATLLCAATGLPLQAAYAQAPGKPPLE